ncbi:Cmx/CmrA family chloramphenicol efflux MFS transporter [Crossiella cryophila]|uniref:DHA1 family chloramphenicol resistance protein-like MFS transporter n=1 Tax=Crossiella cryophila TaxID=43355 RepID=A0A7W7CGU4_9PSEU|nr:Cmx/CmrA family chloramphenicol efflux MFS transporter [Crossiella cryophila]MBB4679234.1 DHA1 family chloramphenicol resistance protein-like MFS transporter [Crossiella cryophila]
MPVVLYLLALAVFAQGTSEFMLSGLLPDLAADLHVSIPAAGALTSAFAAGMIVGAPLMAILSLRWPPRHALLAFLSVFLVVHVLGALTTSYPVLLATRVVAALANAGFLAVALATAAALVAADAKGRATAVLLGGVTLACVAGVPAGALLGQAWGWRSAFWAVALVSAPALVAILRWVPAGRAEDAPGVRGELRALRRPRLALVLLLGALVNGATFCTFTYLAPMVTEVAGIGADWVPAVLALFGIGSFLGVSLGGRIADSRPRLVLAGGGVALVCGWTLFALTAGAPVVALVLVLVQGMLSFAVGATLISQALYAAVGAPRLGGAGATAAFNVGAALGPWAGGLAIAAGYGYRAPLWVSAGLAGAALLVGLAAHRVAVSER